MNANGSNRQREILAEIEAAYAEWAGVLTRFAGRLCGNREDAEDILVETFTEAFRRWDSFRGIGSRRNWLYAIVANRVRMKRRKRRFDVEPLGEEIPCSEASTVELLALYQEVAKLPTGQREAFLLVKGEGLTAREAAEILGKPLGTVLYEVHRAVLALRDALEVEDRNGVGLPCGVEP